MKTGNSISDISLLLAMVHWAFAFAGLGHDKLGVLGAIGGFMLSPAIFPFSPLTAWLFMDTVNTMWFYGFLAVAGAGWMYSHFTRRRIYDEMGREL
jgi:hypothetical protein